LDKSSGKVIAESELVRNAKTNETIDIEIKEELQPHPDSPLVRGHIKRKDGTPILEVTVIAVDKNLRKEQELGRTRQINPATMRSALLKSSTNVQKKKARHANTFTRQYRHRATTTTTQLRLCLMHLLMPQSILPLKASSSSRLNMTSYYLGLILCLMGQLALRGKNLSLNCDGTTIWDNV
jgi:hypothetical protein